jgi:hypothetical protein
MLFEAELTLEQRLPERSNVAYLLPSLVETQATLWGAETSGYAAVPINFLLQTEPIAELLKASGASATEPVAGEDVSARFAGSR